MIRLNDLQARLRRFSSVRRGLLNAALGLRLGALAAGSGIAGLLLLSGWLPNAFLNLGLFLVLGCTNLAFLAAYLRKRARFRSALDEAFRMEELAVGANSRIVSALDFLEQGIETPLALRVVERAAEDVAARHESLLDRSERHRSARRFSAALGLLLLLGITPWFGFGRVEDNLRRSWEIARDRLFPVEYALEPGPGIHIRRLNEPTAVCLRFLKRGFPAVTLIVRGGTEGAKRIPLQSQGNGSFSHVLSSDAETTVTIQFEFGQRRTPEVSIVFAAPPLLLNMQAELTYPAYTRMLPRTFEGVQERFMGLPGTRIRLDFTFSKELESATLTWEDSQTLPLELVGRYASVVIAHTQARHGTLQVRDRHGFSLANPLPLEFELQRDEKPFLTLPQNLKEDMPLLESAVPLFGIFGVRAQDDYGLTRCALKWRRSTVASPDLVLEQGEIERLITPVKTREILSFEKVLSGFSLKPGDKITFQVEAVDNCMPEKQHSLSRRFSLFIHQNELDRFSMDQIGFPEGGRGLRGDRIPPAARATTVKAPEGLRNTEKVANEFRGEVAARTPSAQVSGEYRKLELLYRKVLSDLSAQDRSEEKNPPGER
jgi:hypothetical protein